MRRLGEAIATLQIVMLGLDPSIHGRCGTARPIPLGSRSGPPMDPRVKPEGDAEGVTVMLGLDPRLSGKGFACLVMSMRMRFV